MPPVRRDPGSLKPGPVKTEPTANETASPNGSESATPAPDYPWSSPASVTDRQGLSGMFFSLPGVGKTTLLTTMLHSQDEGRLLILNFDEELRSIQDLTAESGVDVWPGEKQQGRITGWAAIDAICNRLLTRKHPFSHIAFDTLNSLYDKFALPDVKKRHPDGRDPRQTYGEANDMVLMLIRNFCGMAREKGVNVAFTCHAEEKQVGENGPIIVRPKVTPGVVQGINQYVSLIGYLFPPLMGVRKLQLSPSRVVAAKIHQPRSGSQLPDKIDNPDLGLLINHLKFRKPYPKPKPKEA